MPSILWVNDNGTTSVVEVDDEGNRIDAPKEAPLLGGTLVATGSIPDAPAPRFKHRRNKRG